MADGGHIDGGWLAAIIGAIGVALGGMGAWLGPRLMGKAAFQEALNHGFQGMMEERRAERAEMQSQISELRGQVVQLTGKVRDLEQINASLQANLDREGLTKGITTPQIKHDGIAGLIELPATTGANDG